MPDRRNTPQALSQLNTKVIGVHHPRFERGVLQLRHSANVGH